ncbi:hypothetical protein [Microbacterium sp. CJ88]|uniref:hypothetical protein n=1 Tax=Microbacterium sp. CJ88 TaxID=3445672 RepID=UPI003F6574A2
MDDAIIRRHLSVGRLTILEVLHDEPGIDEDQLLAEWIRRRPPASQAHARRLPRTIAQLLWQLRNLEWVDDTEGELTITALGEYVREFARLHSPSPFASRTSTVGGHSA